MSVKKAYVGILAFLQVNLESTVGDIIDEITEMCSAKSAGSSATTVHKDEAGVVTHIRCGFFKVWLPLSHVDFGAKASSASGYNPMCKEGSSIWTKLQREAKKAKEALLTAVAAGDIEAGEIHDRLKLIEAERTGVPTHPLGNESLEDALALTSEDLDELVEAYNAESAEFAEGESVFNDEAA